MSKSFNIAVQEHLGSLWITFTDSIDMDNYKLIEETIFQNIQSTTSERVVIDLSKTQALFSSGVGVIMRIHSLSKEHNKILYLVNVNDKVQEGLETMGLDSVLKIYSSTEDFQSDIEKPSE